MAKTQAQIIDEALRRLSVLASGQTAEAEDVAKFDLDAVAKYVNGKRIIDLSGDIYANELGDEFFFSFSSLAAAMYGQHYGLSVSDAVALRADALREIRDIANRAKPVVALTFDRMTY
jgi:hypothetical protein